MFKLKRKRKKEKKKKKKEGSSIQSEKKAQECIGRLCGYDLVFTSYQKRYQHKVERNYT